MAVTQIADVIVSNAIAPYVAEKSLYRNQFYQSGAVVALDALNNIQGGGRIVTVPFWKNLTGEAEVLSDSTPMTPDKITADAQVGPILSRGKSWEMRDLAALAAVGERSPEAIPTAIGQRLAEYAVAERQRALVAILTGLFGGAADTDAALSTHSVNVSLSTGTPTGANYLGVGAVNRAKARLAGFNMFSAIALHPFSKLDLDDARLLSYTSASGESLDPTAFTITDPSQIVPTFMGMRVIECPDIQPLAGAGTAQAQYPVYLVGGMTFGTASQVPILIETDRDILAQSNVIAFTFHDVIHPLGLKWTTSTMNPSNTQLATKTNWAAVMDLRNIQIARVVVNSAYSAA